MLGEWVDFHYFVNGKEYIFSIPGGGFVTLQQLVEVLGLADSNTQKANTSDDMHAELKLTLADVEISDKTRKFVADVESVEFSNPELVWVGNVGSDSTVGDLKEINLLECEYSAELTEEEIDEIDHCAIEAGDWALISLKPFESNETLTITMNNGDQVVVMITDAQDPSVYVGREVIIYDNGEQRAMTSNWEQNQWRTQFGSTDLSVVYNDTSAHWKIESTNGGYYIRSNDGRYLQIDNNNVHLVNNSWEATVLTIQAGSNPDYRIYAANNDSAILTYADNNQYDGFFSAPGGTGGAGNTQRWLYIEEVPSTTDRGGDWMLYFDDDFSDSEVTIHVGETITLRPYNKWEWKEGGLDVQTAHWNVGGSAWSDWTISSSDSTGARYGTTTDGPFQFTRFVKADDQLNTHYWSVQGLATQTGDYTLTNTKNGKTITVHVVDGEPVNKPNTINNIANIKVNLFDYDKNHLLDPSDDSNLANNGNNKSDSVNQMGGSNHFYFLSSGSGNNNNEPWNNYTKDTSNPNLVLTTLGSDGYPVLNHGNSNTSLKYLFDESQTSWHGGNSNDGMIAYPDVVGMFQKDSNGYYYFNSNTNYFYYDTETKTSKLYEHTYTQVSKSDGRVNDKPIGFFPFHDYDSTDDLYVNQNSDLNHHIGMSMELEFMLPRDKKDTNGNDIVFDFSGDDDLWVFVEWIDDNGQKQSKLLLDLGGVHQPISGSINFTTGASTTEGGSAASFIKPNQPYTLKVFYLERGGCDSNCSIRFNLPIIQDLAVTKKLTGLTEAEKAKYANEEFEYELVVTREPDNIPTPYEYPNTENKYERVIIRNAAGEDVTPQNFTIHNGRFTLKDGQTLSITYLDRSDRFTVAELKTVNMENFETPSAERYYHKPQDASLYEEEITLTARQTQATPITDDWVTPQYTLENTEKVTFTNTLKEKNLEVEKKWNIEEGTDHPDSITFTVSATVEDEYGVRQPYAVSELKESDGTTDKVFSLSDSNGWRHEIEHLPVNTPEGKFIFYDINEGYVEGYVLTGSTDITADQYNYCNIDVVKLWPDSNGQHTEVLQVVLKNSAGKYYEGVDGNGEAIFVDSIDNAEIRLLNSDNNYSQRFDRVPYDAYEAVQLHKDVYNHQGLATYRRAIIQYELENSPVDGPIDPTGGPNSTEIHKRIDALRDGVVNPDSPHADEDLTDLHRLYLDYKFESPKEPNGVDLLFVIDHSGSMNNGQWPGNEYRAASVMAALNGENGFVSEFLSSDANNRWAAVGFKGPDGLRDYEWSLENPWNPKTELARTNAGQNGSEILSSSDSFTTDPANIDLDNEGASILSNYTAGFWRAEQFLLNQSVKDDGRKKVVVFISDGVPTLHIDNLGRSLQNAGTGAGSPYYHEENGGCPNKALAEFGYFVNDITSNGYVFGSNMELYTVGLGASMQTQSGAGLLAEMLQAAYGESGYAGHLMTISDVNRANDAAAANKLEADLLTILGLNESFTNIVIQDDLSKYVDLYGLAEAGTDVSAIMTAANAKVTMTVPDSDVPGGIRTITLYENGAPATGDDAKFTKDNGETATIIQGLNYDADSKTVQAVFNSEYHAVEGATYTLSFDVKATDEAYATYAENGYDKYTSEEGQQLIITGDPDTDFLGTDPANATSAGKEGFHSNDEAKATYTHNGEPAEETYPHPVIQVAAKVDIVKIDETGAALEGAKFNLYDDEYEPGKSIEENASHLIEADLQSKKPTDLAGDDAEIRNGKLTVGTYYLVETKAPDGYNALSGPVKITVTETNGIMNVVAEIAGQSVGDKLVKVSGGVWKLSLQDTAGYELPNTGGPGVKVLTTIGALLVISSSLFLLMRRRSALVHNQVPRRRRVR